MKIIMTVATYWPKTDGVQMVTQYQAEGLVRKGHKVTVITSKEQGLSDNEVHNGVLIIRVNARNFYYWHKGNKKEYQRTILSYTQDADALITVCLQSFAADWALDILPHIQCKKVLYLHGMPDFKLHLSDCRNIKNIAKTIFRNLRWKYFYSRNVNKIKKYDAITHLFQDDNSYRYFVKHGYDDNYVLENACEDTFFDIEDKLNNIKCKYFIYVGNYCSRKNQEMAMLAFYESGVCDLSLILIGSEENDYCKKLKQLKRDLDNKYGKRNVEILHNVPREKIAKYTKQAFACVISSNYEYYPITIIEAMAAGLPFISTDVGIVKYLPGGVIANNKQDISYWMSFFAKNRDYATGLGRMGRLYAYNHLRIEQKVNQLEKILMN